MCCFFETAMSLRRHPFPPPRNLAHQAVACGALRCGDVRRQLMGATGEGERELNKTGYKKYRPNRISPRGRPAPANCSTSEPYPAASTTDSKTET